jgi:hypothetical protein
MEIAREHVNNYNREAGEQQKNGSIEHGSARALFFYEKERERREERRDNSQ